MFIQQIIEFALRGPGPLGLGCKCTPELIIFMTKQKFPSEIFECMIIYPKILQEAVHLTSPYLGLINYKM